MNMKGAPDIKAGTTNKPAAPIVASTVQRRSARSLSHGQTTRLQVMGEAIAFTLERIPHNEIKARTRVWGGNERLQQLLSEEAVADIDFSNGGQEEPGRGRWVKGTTGQIEVADGSRRRFKCLQTGHDYWIWVAHDLDNRQMEHLSTIGNQYRAPSAYEKGTRYAELLGSTYDSERAMAEAMGVDRKTMRRYLACAKLPIEVLQAYPCPNDLSARAGEDMAKAMANIDLGYALLIKQAQSKPADLVEPDAITRSLMHAIQPPKPAPAPKRWKDTDWKVAHEPGQGLTIEVGEAVPKEVRDRIEKLLKKELDK